MLRHRDASQIILKEIIMDISNSKAQEMSIEHNWKRWLSTEDLRIIYGFSKSTVAKWRMSSNSSQIPFSKIGGKYIRYDRIKIDEWLESHQVQGVA